MSSVITGNAASLAQRSRYNGWFIGHFIDDDTRFCTNALEIKWGIHAAGDTNGEYTLNTKSRTLSVLISGRFHLQFSADPEKQDVILASPGDFALWEAGTGHLWHALEDCTVLTVRWPSLPGDRHQP